MSFAVVAIAGATLGAAKMIKGGIDKSKARKRQNAAKEQLEAQMDEYMNQEVKNPYEGLENMSEDLTVDTKAAEFAAQKSEQARADTMGSLAASAGSSGIAALAQSMANQATQEAQAASQSIASQEQANQAAERAEAGNIRDKVREGQIMVQNIKDQKMGTKLGMTQQELAAETQSVAAADTLMSSGMSDFASAVGGMTFEKKPPIDPNETDENS